jgi:hypothetical protein
MTYLPKAQVLGQAAQALYNPDQPWEYSVQGDQIIGYWKWRDGVFFAQGHVGTDIQQYSFTVTLADDGTYKERDRTEQKESSFGSSGGGMEFSSNKSTNVGSTRMKFYALAPGIDRTTGQAGMVRTAFDTEWVKQPLRGYLQACGWTKAKGFFGRMKKGRG